MKIAGICFATTGFIIAFLGVFWFHAADPLIIAEALVFGETMDSMWGRILAES